MRDAAELGQNARWACGVALLGHAKKRGAGSGPRDCWATVEGAPVRLGLDHRLGLRSEREGRARLTREKKKRMVRSRPTAGPKEGEGVFFHFPIFNPNFKYDPNQIQT